MAGGESSGPGRDSPHGFQPAGDHLARQEARIRIFEKIRLYGLSVADPGSGAFLTPKTGSGIYI